MTFRQEMAAICGRHFRRDVAGRSTSLPGVAGKEITRTDLRRALAVNALTKPVNVLVPAAVVVAAVIIGAWWLWVVAIVVFAVLCAQTFFDEDEAKKVGDRTYGRERPASHRVDTRKLAPRSDCRAADIAVMPEPSASRVRKAD